MLVILVDMYSTPQVLDMSDPDKSYTFYQEEGELSLEDWEVAISGKEYTVAEVLREAELAGLALDQGGGTFTLRQASHRTHSPIAVTLRADSTIPSPPPVCVKVFGFEVCA